MATPSVPNALSASTASFRTSQSQAHPPSTFSYSESALTQLPTIDFNFDDLRKRMSDFSAKFDAFIENGRKRVLEERNEFRGRLGEIHEEQRSTNTQISTLQSTLSSHDHLIAREQVEKSEMHAQIANLECHQANQMTAKDRLKNSIAQTQRQIDAKLQAQQEYSRKMDDQSRLNEPELNFWETYLGCRIEGAGDECMVKIVYTFPPPRGSKEEREASFELQVPETGGGGYRVVHALPKLDTVKVDKVVDRLNESRDIATLLKGMRVLFSEQMK